MKQTSAKKTAAFLIIVFLSAITACSKNAPSTVNDAVNGTRQVYKNFYEILIKNKTNPEAGLVTAKDFINKNRYDMSIYGEILRKKLEAEEMVYIEDFNKELSAMSKEASDKIKEHYSKIPEADNKIFRMIQTLQFFHNVNLDKEVILRYREEQAKSDK
jgi:hypothetical protein